MKKNYFKGSMLVVAGLLILSSCKKESADAPESAKLKLRGAQAVTITPGASPVSITDGGGTISRDANNVECQSYHVLNFFQGTVNPTPSDPHDRATTYYFNLFDNKGGTSSLYDLRFTGTANGDISAGPDGELAYINKAYCSVTRSDFHADSVQSVIGKENTINYPVPPTTRYTGPGWYNYNFAVHIVSPLSGRTLIYKSGSDYFKIEIQSIYQDGTPDSPIMATDFPYYKFRYTPI
ncbi:hypothetical protein [Pedobacter deserti]|uniref:hypothetical protein n=1 Tax=Pedobacter deserti TaxID=2817382 RepID=UPI00210DBB7E|nr:hypothetical protein [Pedobacter sp. SYSU D00382]